MTDDDKDFRDALESAQRYGLNESGRINFPTTEEAQQKPIRDQLIVRRWRVDVRSYHRKTWALLPCLQLFIGDSKDWAITLSFLRVDLRLITFLASNAEIHPPQTD